MIFLVFMCFLNERVVNGGVKREIERVCVCVRERENVVVVVAAGCAALILTLRWLVLIPTF